MAPDKNQYREEEVGGWHYSNDFNSTKFSNCCGSALTSGHCSSCGKKCDK